MARARNVCLVLTILTITALAGCAGKDATSNVGTTGPDGKVSEEQAVSEINVKPTATTGIIRGIVVDEAIRPIPKALVSVQTAEKVLYANTTANGAYGFGGLQPGTYFVKAHKAGFTDIQINVDVVANVADPPLARIQMAADASFVKPYVEAFVFKGIIECSFSAGVVSGAACSLVNDPVCGDTGLPAPADQGPCTGNLTNDNFATHYPLQAPLPDWVQSEMVWQSTQATGANLVLEYSRDCGEENAGFLCDYDVVGPSPLLLTADKSQVANVTLQQGTGLNDVYVRVFNHGVDGTDPSGTFGFGLTFQQQFTVYTHIFHGFTPTAGYRFTVDGAPTVPAS